MDPKIRNHLFGQRVKALRVRQGLKQHQLAEQIGKADDTISKIETGTTSTRISTAFEIADALGVSFLELFDWVQPRKLTTEDARTEKLVDAFRAMLRGEREITADEVKTIMSALARQQRPRS